MDERTFRELVTDREGLYRTRDGLAPRERKKVDERLALEKVYRGQPLTDVIWRERPDFAFRLNDSHKRVGVEVCRYYDSQSAARLSEFVGYSDTLLGGGPRRHKDDVTGFDVTAVGIIDAEGKTVATDVPAIVRQMPAMGAVVEGLRSQIEAKEELFPLDDGLQHANLIVDDRAGPFAASDSQDLYRHIASPDLSRAVFQSQFREIFLITRFTSGASYVPLKMLLTLARLHFFHDALAAMADDGDVLPEGHIELFGEYLTTLTDQAVGIRHDAEATEVLFGDTGFVVEEEGSGAIHTKVRMYRDGEWPSWRAVQASCSLGSQLHQATSELMSANTFVSGIAFPIELFELSSE